MKSKSQKKAANPSGCLGCGSCCQQAVCVLGQYVFGTVEKCPALRLRKGRYWCHLLEVGVPAEKPILDTETKTKVVGRKSIPQIILALEIGKGCPNLNNADRIELKWRMQIQKLASRIEVATRNGMMEGEYSRQADDDREKVWKRTKRLQSQGESFSEAYKHAKIEFIEELLSRKIKEMECGDVLNSNSGEEQKRKEEIPQREDNLSVVS